ncbi:MAG: hypothetical protein ABIA92_04160 [Patescibacteria group bacterium]
MKQRQPRTSGFDRDHLRLLKHASAESKLNALTAMIDFAQEAERSCKKRGAKYHPIFPE